MKALVFLFTCLTVQPAALSQHISITLRNAGAERGILLALSGEKASAVDSTTSNGNGRFDFRLNKQNAPGIYRLALDRNKWIDFLNDGENVEISSDVRAPFDSLKVVHSESNRLYYDFLKLNREYKTKTEILQLVLARYTKGDTYYHTTQKTATRLQKEYSDFINIASQRRPASFIARYIRSAQLPIVDFNLPIEKQLALLKAHALDHVGFYDADLIQSDVFTSKTIEYLTYFRNPQLPKELLEKEFMTAVDSILNRAKFNQPVYKHITEYLIDGFKKFGFEQCISYILDNYVIKDDLCLDQGSGMSIQRMIDQKKRLPIGAFAPNITLPDSSGRAVSLDDMQTEKVLILFFSSSCPHCQTMVPALCALYSQLRTQGVVVLAISLDDSRDNWLRFLRTNKVAWINVYEKGGWSGKAALDYYVYATPTMILVDKQRKIVSKPLSIDELLHQTPHK